MSLSSKLVRNSITACVGRLWTAGTTFVVMPLMLYVLKQDALGVWFLSNSLVMVSGLADLGMASAISKYIPEHLARRDTKALNADANTSIFFYFCLAILCMVLGVVFGDDYLRFVKTPPELMPQARVMFLWVIAAVSAVVFTNVWRGMLTAVHRLDITNTTEIIVSVPWLVGMVAALKLGYGLVGIAIVQFAQFAVILVVLAVLAWRMTPGFRLDMRYIRWSSFRRLIGFGAQASLAGVAGSIYVQAEQLIITRLLGPGIVGLYQFGFKIGSVFTTTFASGFYAVVPAASEISAGEAPSQVHTLYERGTKFLLAFVVPAGALLAAMGPIVITAWLGAGYGISIFALRALTMAAVAQVGVGMAKSVGRGVGRLAPELVGSGVFLASFLILAFGLGHAYGFPGIMAASLGAALIGALVVIVMLHRAMGWPVLPALTGLYGVPALISLLAGLPVYWYNHLHRAEIAAIGHMSARAVRLAPMAIGEILVFSAITLLLLRLFRYITPQEFHSLRSALKGMRGAHSTPVAPEARSEPLSSEA